MKKLVLSALVIFALISLINCGDKIKEEVITDTSPQVLLPSAPILQLSLGYRLLEDNCFSCHNATADQGNRIAPPMELIKRAYNEKYTSVETFSQAISTFVLSPSREKSELPEAIEQYGIMPQMIFTKEEFEALSSYIYDEELEFPEWMK